MYAVCFFFDIIKAQTCIHTNEYMFSLYLITVTSIFVRFVNRCHCVSSNYSSTYLFYYLSVFLTLKLMNKCIFYISLLYPHFCTRRQSLSLCIIKLSSIYLFRYLTAFRTTYTCLRRRVAVVSSSQPIYPHA